MCKKQNTCRNKTSKLVFTVRCRLLPLISYSNSSLFGQDFLSVVPSAFIQLQAMLSDPAQLAPLQVRDPPPPHLMVIDANSSAETLIGVDKNQADTPINDKHIDRNNIDTIFFICIRKFSSNKVFSLLAGIIIYKKTGSELKVMLNGKNKSVVFPNCDLIKNI